VEPPTGGADPRRDEPTAFGPPRTTVGSARHSTAATTGQPHAGVLPSGPADILIGDDVELHARAVVLPGTVLGEGSVVTAGSVASGVIPPRSRVVGNPGQVEPLPLGEAQERSLQAELDAGTHVADNLCRVAQRAPHRLALRCGSVELSYGQLLGWVQGVRAGLEAQGVTPGARVLLGCSEKAAFVAGFYGITSLGAVAVPLVEGVSRASVAEILEVSGATACVTTTASAPQLEGAMPGVPLLRADTCAPIWPWRAPYAGPVESAALILFTSGTTAKKKGVVLSHRALMAATRSINAFMQLRGDVREYVAVPLTHSFGLGRIRALFARGAAAVLSDGMVNPPVIAQAMREGRCDALAAVPAVLTLFSGRYAPLLRELGPRLRFVELGSAPMPAQTRRALMELFPRARLCMHYGLTEASRSAFLEFHGEAAHLDTVGRASPGVELVVQDEGGRAVPAGVEGEVVVRGAHLGSEYLGDRERSAAAFRADGFHTGDYGVLDAQGYLRLLGRRDEMINSGGIKISPLELEAKVRAAYPDLEFCVLGLPDPTGVAGDVAAVVTVGAPGLTLEVLNGALADSVDRGRLPRVLREVEALPKTENGKVQRALLRAQLLR
jgi:long-chain acyl-CoA synthetase